MPISRVTVKPLRSADVHAMCAWVYPPPYDVYSFEAIPEEEALSFFLDPANEYFGLFDETDSLVGFCNFGWDARVEGGDYDVEAVDIGIGLRPDLTGRGLGIGYAQAVFEEAEKRQPGLPLRVTIMAFNERALQVCRKSGFLETSRFKRPSDGAEFVILLRPAGP